MSSTGDLIILGKRERYDKEKYYHFDVTSHNIVRENRESLSPFYLGPVECYDGLVSQNMENAWQYSKVYPDMADENGNPTAEYYKWRDMGWAKKTADRHPHGRDIPLYALWKDKDGNELRLDYITSRKIIYIPLYAKAVIKAEYGLKLLSNLLANNNLALCDFDGYNQKKLGMTYYDVLNNPKKKMGHAFVLGMLLQGLVYEKNGEIVIDEEAMKLI